jgi:hypothetical protein
MPACRHVPSFPQGIIDSPLQALLAARRSLTTPGSWPAEPASRSRCCPPSLEQSSSHRRKIAKAQADEFCNESNKQPAPPNREVRHASNFSAVRHCRGSPHVARGRGAGSSQSAFAWRRRRAIARPRRAQLGKGNPAGAGWSSPTASERRAFGGQPGKTLPRGRGNRQATAHLPRLLSTPPSGAHASEGGDESVATTKEGTRHASAGTI